MLKNTLRILNFLAQLLSCVQLFVTPRAAAHQAPLSFTISQHLFKLYFVDSFFNYDKIK